MPKHCAKCFPWIFGFLKIVLKLAEHCCYPHFIDGETHTDEIICPVSQQTSSRIGFSTQCKSELNQLSLWKTEL